MVKTYKTRPCQIEAIEWNGNNVKEILVFMGRLPHVDYVPMTNNTFESIMFENWIHNQTDLNNRLTIKTLEGNMKANVGDYIIKGLKGEFYPCKPDVFNEKYEEIK